MKTTSPKGSLYLMLSAALAAGGCSFTRFDDLEKLAPATRVEEGGGTPFAGLVRQPASTQQPGGQIVLGAESIYSVVFEANGSVGTTSIPRNKWSDDLKLDGHSIKGYAPAPVDRSENAGDALFYLGATSASSGRVMIVGSSFRAAVGLPLGTVVAKNIESFGIALAPAALSNAGRTEDLVIGATGGVVLVDGRSWPNLNPSELLAIPNGFTSGTYRAIVAGELDHTTLENEIAVAADDRNFVAVLANAKSCLPGSTRSTTVAGDAGVGDGGAADAGAGDAGTADAGATDLSVAADSGSAGGCQLRTVAFEIPATQDGVVAGEFGFSLLIADVNGDGDNELVVGAPASEIDGESSDQRSGAVYVYSLKEPLKNPPQGKVQLTPEVIIKAPAGARRFGSALAFGKFDGQSQLLAISAPETTVGNQKNAGQVLVYAAASLSEPRKKLELATPSSDGDLLGLRLTSMPFFSGDRRHDVLVASANKSAVVFFSNVTPDHKDFRK